MICWLHILGNVIHIFTRYLIKSKLLWLSFLFAINYAFKYIHGLFPFFLVQSRQPADLQTWAHNAYWTACQVGLTTFDSIVMLFAILTWIRLPSYTWRSNSSSKICAMKSSNSSGYMSSTKDKKDHILQLVNVLII